MQIRRAEVEGDVDGEGELVVEEGAEGKSKSEAEEEYEEDGVD